MHWTLLRCDTQKLYAIRCSGDATVAMLCTSHHDDTIAARSLETYDADRGALTVVNY
jgi:hypothetical protein